MPVIAWFGRGRRGGYAPAPYNSGSGISWKKIGYGAAGLGALGLLAFGLSKCPSPFGGDGKTSEDELCNGYFTVKHYAEDNRGGFYTKKLDDAEISFIAGYTPTEAKTEKAEKPKAEGIRVIVKDQDKEKMAMVRRNLKDDVTFTLVCNEILGFNPYEGFTPPLEVSDDGKTITVNDAEYIKWFWRNQGPVKYKNPIRTGKIGYGDDDHWPEPKPEAAGAISSEAMEGTGGLGSRVDDLERDLSLLESDSAAAHMDTLLYIDKEIEGLKRSRVPGLERGEYTEPTGIEPAFPDDSSIGDNRCREDIEALKRKHKEDNYRRMHENQALGNKLNRFIQTQPHGRHRGNR